mmetsp:Transcript_2542/g.5708  ORF Transcript_2542/g.5708 Transcript_2542/m.5708 type:complete len:215 (-) Transcript_2542:103-747(-)|eukprot:CAMPEP_0197592112 /NCGR_PEP_ID=MMETSP1326-20131121/14688_1 /TAXON_ID=1155430 /ORGANISM="Genus nov. species nov., Strain RCC2288" /LENGTH=214 /DNA_ID=CAMNT_0043157761 /DNA_START=132 /DNA_END=776 /DNA_ORIENTATION=+
MQIKEGADRYNPEKLKEFEEEVAKQASGASPYNPDVNFTVLRIYQFYPSYATPSIVQKILLMGLMRVPSTDFGVYLHMLSEVLMKEEPVPALAAMGKSLAACNFAEFWAGVDKQGSAVFGQAAGFEQAVRVGILGALGVSHVKVPLDALKASLDLKDDAGVKAFLAAAANPCWVLGADGLAVSGQVEAASISTAKDSEVLPFDKLDSVFTAKSL